MMHDPQSAGIGQDCVQIIKGGRDGDEIIMYTADCALEFNYICKLGIYCFSLNRLVLNILSFLWIV